MPTFASRFIDAIQYIAAVAGFTWASGGFGIKSHDSHGKCPPYVVSIAAAAWLSVLVSPSFSQTTQPPTAPILRIEAGVHTSAIEGIATDKLGRFAVTGGHDKTVRVWDVATGHLLNTLRVPVDEPREGWINTVAISPDGATIVAAGWAGFDWNKQHHIYFFDRVSGRMSRRFAGLPRGVLNMAISHDGQWLAAVLGGAQGLRIFSLKPDGVMYSDTGYEARSVSFGPNNRLATISPTDGRVRLYSINTDRLTKLAEASAPGGNPSSVAFSPIGSAIAVSYSESSRIDVLNAQTLALLYKPISVGMDGGRDIQVAWAADGRSLYAGGRWKNTQERMLVRKWGDSGRGRPMDIATVKDTIQDIKPLPYGGVLVAGSDTTWGVVDANEKWNVKTEIALADLRSTTHAYGNAMSTNARTVQFGYEFGGSSPHLFRLSDRALVPGTDLQLLAPITQGINVRDWHGKPNPTLNGEEFLKKKEFSDGESYGYSLAVAPGARSFAIGTRKEIFHVDAAGAKRWGRFVSNVPWSLNISSDGRLLVAAYGDGVIRWHRLSDGQELLAFFPHADRKRWVLWTPSGYYDASPGGEELIGWHLNRGQDQAADFFPASRFRSQFYRPDVIDRVLDTLDESAALTQANEASNRRTQVVAVAQVLPPMVELVAGSEMNASQTDLKIRVRARSAADAPVTALRVRVDGQLQADARGLGRQDTAQGDEREVTVRVPSQDAEVQVFAENRHGVSVPAVVRVKWTGAKPAATGATGAAGAGSAPGFQIQPKLYVLAVGVADYQHKDIARLSLSAKDARDFAGTLQRQQGKLYRQVEVKLLTDGQATADAVIEGLEWLQKQVTQHDIAMVFVAGHGLNDPTLGYTYLAVNSDPERLRRTAVPMDEFRKTLAGLPGKAVFFFDTCHSGNVLGSKTRAAYNDVSGVINELANAENGVVVFSSSTGRQLSYEDAAWGNGAFTKALVEGLGGAADFQKNGRITHKMLDLYVSERVKELTRGKQSPVTQAPGGVPDFPLAVK